MKTGKQFVKDLEKEFNPIYKITELIAHKFFNSNPSKEQLLEHFKRKMFNERWNMIELAQKVSKLDLHTDTDMCVLLSKQVMDEAKHYKMVREVLDHINGGPIDLDDAHRTHGTKNPSQGASLIDKYEAHGDEMTLALYQFLAEGRAAVSWQTMSEIVEDEFVASRYSKIARDEKFHSNIGRMSLEKLCETPEMQEKCSKLAKEMYWDLYEISCLSNTAPTQEMKDIMTTAYGQPTRELAVAI